MVHLKARRHPEQQPLLTACTTSPRRPAPAVPPLPGIAAEVLFDLRADDALDTSFAAERALLAVPMHDPSEGSQPIAALVDRAVHQMRCRDIAFVDDLAEDRRLSDARCTLIAAAAWVDDAAGFALEEDCAAVLDAVAARPELAHDTALLMALAPVVAMLKGSVA